MFGDDPLAYFITWTVYGSFLQGDARGWRLRRKGEQAPEPQLEGWRRERLKHASILLSKDDRHAVARGCHVHCDIRGWKLWEVNARSNHVHVVVTAREVSGRIVRDQLKANCTRELRSVAAIFRDRPVWTVGGDVECINNEEDLEVACDYVRDAQDRKDRDERRGTGR